MSVSTEEKSEALGQSDVAFSEEVDGEASEAFENIPRRRTSSEALSEASCSISSITSTNSSSNSVANNSNCNSVSETDSAVSTPPLTPGLTEKDKDTDSSSVGENGGDMHSPITISHLLRTRSLSSARRKCLASGPKFKLLQEGDIQVCRLNHTRTVISKILSSKFLRRWETHHLILRNSLITSRTRSGFMETAIAYSQIEDVYVVSRWDAGNKFCVRVVVPDGSVLLQAHSAYVRDQWMHSIQWKRNIYKFHELLKNATRSEILLKELKNLVDTTVSCALQDECIHQVPLDIASDILQRSSVWMPRSCHEDIITALAPLLENNHPTPEICDFFSQHCRNSPRSSLVTDMFTTVVQRILKHNVDFGKYPKMRTFVQNYILALGSHNDGLGLVRGFVMSVHGAASTCPHPRVLHNLVSIGLAAIFSLFEERRNATTEEKNEINSELEDWDHKLYCFIAILETMVSYEDWRPGVAHLLQPIPFPDDALAHSRFTSSLKRVIRYIATDSRCDVHVLVQSVREGKEGWFQLYCPGSLACDDEGQLWSTMLKTLVGCCCRRKKFLTPLNKQLGALMLLAIRDDITCQEVLCAMLELDVVENPDYKLQMVSTLQSTTTGKQHYAALCDRQMHLRELQQKGGPKKLTLPSRSTDADVAKLLSCGSFGNLECLSLAFTHVTSACAEQLVKLPSLRYLNLWSTQFGDAGLQLISEHLHKLQVLNLCETPVTDKGLVSLAAMKNLRKLNLNSTSLSAETFEGLKQKLPALQECDVRYTDAW